jgi:hypothetical protein
MSSATPSALCGSPGEIEDKLPERSDIGRRGGEARAAKLTQKKRTAIAKKAAKATSWRVTVTGCLEPIDCWAGPANTVPLAGLKVDRRRLRDAARIPSPLSHRIFLNVQI